MKRLSALLVAVVLPALFFFGRTVQAQEQCDNDLTGKVVGCVKALDGLPTGWGNPPAHQPSRCALQPPVVTKTITIDPDGGVTTSETSQHFSGLDPWPMEAYLDADPTDVPSPDLPFLPPGADFGGPLIVGGTGGHQYQLWGSECIDPLTGEIQPGSARNGWVRVVSVANLVRPALLRAIARMSDVELSWPTVSPRWGWQMVRAPLEIRGTVPGTVSETQSASNLTGSASVTVTATPSHVVFDSGDAAVPGLCANGWPAGWGSDKVPCSSVVCPVEQLSWAVPDPEHPSPCSVTYVHSSVQRNGQPFTTQLITVWNLQTPDPAYNGAWPLPASSTDLLVAETQALVTG